MNILFTKKVKISACFAILLEKWRVLTPMPQKKFREWFLERAERNQRLRSTRSEYLQVFVKK